MPDKTDKELKQERKKLQGELDHEVEKSKEIDEKRPFDWLIHMMKSFLLTFQLMSLPSSDETKKDDKKKSFEDTGKTLSDPSTSKPELSDSKMLKGLGMQPKAKPPQVVPTVPITPTHTDPLNEDNDEEEESQKKEGLSGPFSTNPFDTELHRK